MGIATPNPQPSRSHLSPFSPWANSGASMSHGFHQDIFSFSNGFDRAASQDQHHLAHHSRRDKLRPEHGFDPLADAKGDESLSGIYDSPAGAANMLSEMFSFPAPGQSSADLLASQLPGNYRLPERPSGFSSDWYGSNRDSAAVMQLFLRSPSPSTTLHHQQAFQAASSFGAGDPSFSGAVVEGQGLSLSLSSSLQRLEVAKAQELRARADEMGAAYFDASQQQSSLHFIHQGQQGQGVGQLQHMGYGSAGVVNVLRNSKYARAARELLEEFCSVSRGQLKRKALGGSANPNASHGGGGASSSAAPAGSSSSSKGLSLPSSSSPADRFEQQRKKAKLLSMLDEVDRRYSHYCDQMQMVVNSFDSVMGFGAAAPYTALARKAMSRHFRCLKDVITGELKQICELLGEKDTAGSSGITKSETPRLKFLDQSLRQQRAFHQMGIMDQEAWRPPRGLPERSVSILRAWLFDHFLHPYPSDADKHLLARQTGLSRNQVSNWFINARVRLWKPMVEEIYQQESKAEEDNNKGERAQPSHQTPQTRLSPTSQQHHQRPETDAPENDSSSIAGPHRSEAHQSGATATAIVGPTSTTLGAAARMRLAASGDVSLTLGLRHAGNTAAGQEESPFSVRDFRNC